MGNFGGMFPMGNFQMKNKKKKDTEKTQYGRYRIYTIFRIHRLCTGTRGCS